MMKPARLYVDGFRELWMPSYLPGRITRLTPFATDVRDVRETELVAKRTGSLIEIPTTGNWCRNCGTVPLSPDDAGNGLWECGGGCAVQIDGTRTLWRDGHGYHWVDEHEHDAHRLVRLTGRYLSLTYGIGAPDTYGETCRLSEVLATTGDLIPVCHVA